LPRVEEQLFLMLTNYERERGQILLIDGADYRLSVQKQWADHEKSKENEKLQKVNIEETFFFFFVINFKLNLTAKGTC